jgi:uncharacterized protein YkwD
VKRRWFDRLIHFALFGVVFLAGCPDGQDVAGVSVRAIPSESLECSVPENADALIQRVLELVNDERQSRGLHALELNATLCQMADDYCCAMIECDFFSHEDPDTGKGPGKRAIDAGYVFLAIGENLACGQTSPEQVMAEWMSSAEGHSEIILGHQWREIGISVRTGGRYGVYWVQEFGNPID